MTTRSPRVLRQHAADLATDGLSIEPLARALETSAQARQALLDPFREALVLGFLLLATVD